MAAFNFRDCVVEEVLNNNAEDKFITLLVRLHEKHGILRIDRPVFKNIIKDIVPSLSLKDWDMDNGKYLTGNILPHADIDGNRISVTYPATEWDIQKARPSLMYNYRETPAIYNEFTLKKLVPSDRSRLKWVDDIISGVKEADRVVYKDDDIVVLPDMKWNPEELEALYCQAIFKDVSLRSIRDLRENHIDLLLKAKENIEDTIKKCYGVESRFLRIYFHYCPSFWQLHLHITMNAKKDLASAMDRSHLIEDVIQNLKVMPNFYKDRDITIKVMEKDLENLEDVISSLQ